MAKRIKRWFDTPFDLIDVVLIFAILGFILFIASDYTKISVNSCVNAGHTIEYCEKGLK